VFSRVSRRSTTVTFDAVLSPASILPSIGQDLYITDILSRNSSTRAECSLFLGDSTSFSRER
jgi:hypothetical protein